MQHFIQKFFDILFPPTAEMLIVRNIQRDNIQTLLTPRSVDGCVALSDFKNPYIRALIHEAKFHSNARAQKILGELLVLYLKSQPQFQNAICIPMPLSRERVRERGYNQIEEILISTKTLRVDTGILVRTKNTLPQTKIPKHERIRNVSDAFTLKKTSILEPTHLLLIDDVITTGATMNAARATLRKASPTSVSCLALAH